MDQRARTGRPGSAARAWRVTPSKEEVSPANRRASTREGTIACTVEMNQCWRSAAREASRCTRFTVAYLPRKNPVPCTSRVPSSETSTRTTSISMRVRPRAGGRPTRRGRGSRESTASAGEGSRERRRPTRLNIRLPWERGHPTRLNNRLPWERRHPTRLNIRLPWERGHPARLNNRLPWERGHPARVDNRGPSAGRPLRAFGPGGQDARAPRGGAPEDGDSRDHAGGRRTPAMTRYGLKARAPAPFRTPPSAFARCRASDLRRSG